MKILNWLIILIGFLEVIKCKQVLYWQYHSVSALSAVFNLMYLQRGLVIIDLLFGKVLYWQYCSVSSLVVFYIIWYIIIHHQLQYLEQIYCFAPGGLPTLKPHCHLASVKFGTGPLALKEACRHTSLQESVLHTMCAYVLFRSSLGLSVSSGM